MEDYVKLCNCASCAAVLLGSTNPPRVKQQYPRMPRVATRVDGRPYCMACYVAYSQWVRSRRQRW